MASIRLAEYCFREPDAGAAQMKPEHSAAEAVTDCDVIQIDADALQCLLRDNAKVAMMMLSDTCPASAVTGDAGSGFEGAKRVAGYLPELFPCIEGACEVVLPYDKLPTAGLWGVMPQSQYRTLAKRCSHGMTIPRNTAAIVVAMALRAVAEAEPAAAWSR